MRLKALCVFGTLLALTSLPWTSANSGEGDLLGDKGFRPCAATLRPEGACRQGQDENTCPYLFSLPPLTVHLPKQLRELEKIVKDLQKLKDNVDQLRKMCADCTVSQSERECGRQTEREREKLNEGADTYGDEKNWMNGRDPERLKDYGADRVKVEITMDGDSDTDTENRTTLDEKERNKWEAERQSEKRVVKENEKEDHLKEVAEKDGKSQTEWTKGKDKSGQTKVPAAGGKETIVDMEREKGFESNNRDAHKNRNKEKDGKGLLMGEQEDTLDSEQERMMNINMKNTEKIPENDRDVRQDATKETKKKTQSEEDRSSDGIKMSKEHDEHTNKVQEQHREERKKEMEKGIKAGQNNEKAKQTENSGWTEKRKTIEEVETEEVVDRETGREIKTKGEKSVQSEQGDSDGESASSKATERTDFVSISSTPQSTTGLDGRYDSMDSHKAIVFTSSPPSSPLSGFASRLITDVSQEAKITASELTTQSNGEAGISEHANRPTTIKTRGGPRHQITSATISVISTTSVRPRTGFQGSTTTPSYNSYTTTYSGVTDHSRWTAKNNSSNAKTGVKPLPGRGPQPDKKHKPGVKPEADQRPKNLRNYRKPDQAHLPDNKPKHDQKQKPSPQKPTTDQEPKPGKDTKQVQMSKPDQRVLSDNLTTDQNLKNNLIPKHVQDHTTEENKLPNRKPNSHQKSVPPVQTPVTVNTTSPDKDPLTDRQPEYDETSIINRNSKPDKILHHTPKTNKPNQKQTPGRKTTSREKSKSDQRSETNQNFTHVQESERSGTTHLAPKHEPETELIRKHDGNHSFEPKSKQDSAPGQNLTPRVIMPPDQKPKSSQTISKNNQKPKPGNTPKFNHKHPVLVTDQKPKPNVKPKQGQAPQNNQRIKTPLSAQMPNLNPKSVTDEIPEAESSKTGKPRPPPRHRPPTRPVLKPGTTHVQKPKPAAQPKPSLKTKADSDLPHISVTTSNSIQNSQTDLPPKSGAVKQTDDVTHSPGVTEFSPSTASAKTSNSLETRSFPHLHTLPESFTMSPNSRITSDLRPQAVSEPISIPVTTRPNNIIHGSFPSVFSSTSPGSTKPNLVYNTDSSLQDTILHKMEETAHRPSPDPDKMMIPVPSPSAQTTSTVSSDFRSRTSANSGLKLPDAESSTPSARELRVKINQVAALFNNSLSLNGKPLDRGPKEHLEDKQGGSSPDKADSKLPTLTSSKGKRYYFTLSCLVKFYLCVCVNTMYYTKHY